MPAFDQRSSFAILFGVAKYAKAESYESMPWIENNLTELRTILVDQDLVGFQDDDDRVLVRLNPSHGQLGDDLDEIRKQHSNIDTLLVYYCGHGVVQAGNYFLTGSDSGDSAASKLLFATFEDILLQIKAKRKVLILDSCFSGRAVSHLSSSTSTLAVNVERFAEKEANSSLVDSSRRGTYVVASADRDKPSPSTDGAGALTAFTSLLVNRVRQGLERREDERLTITDIVEALKSEALQPSVKAGRELADADMAESLFHRGRGYSHPAEKITVVKVTEVETRPDGTVIRTEDWKDHRSEYIQHYPPDTASAIFWLKNRRRDLWRDAPAVVVNNQNNQLAVTNGDPVGTMQDYRRIVDSSDEL